ncbi:structural maintenance of chromosomes protein 5 isoform X5 [Durio zibethinus]|uniref:Structural maintenance of chromosomes protein 5 n=1 Tax=Durio zibethinus TaxID=66656 RepID=A0A6P5WSG6_DURZI|nr:structural maintenance of chromosomes protein 5 isoform X5 [Durio zibethinus]
MEEPRVKRPKISRGKDDYLPGNITEIELYNFMTFNHLVCKPGPRLNLVIGPNGSGKSSLVCAIALCLGGEPQLLGRATNIGAYVKRGEESGYIKITLRGYTKEEQIPIVRKIDTRNKSEWLYNGKSVPKREILEVIRKFNIQVNNLTQFLPQDRVCEFAKLTPIQLLEETEKAVGDPQLPVQHCALVEKSRELKRYQKAAETMGESLKQLITLNAEQEKDVERVRQRDELLEKVDSMKKKLPWLKYDMKKTEYLEAQKREKDAKKKLDEAAKKLNVLKAPIEKQKQEKVKLDDKCKHISNLMNENIKKRINLLQKENEAAVQARGKYKEVEDLRREEDSRKQSILEAKKKLAAAEEDLQNLPTYEPPKEEIERLKSQIVELTSSAHQKMQQKKEKENSLGQMKTALRNCVDSLKDMENTNNKLLHALQKSGAEKIVDAYRWLEQHRDELNKDVYGPVLLEEEMVETGRREMKKRKEMESCVEQRKRKLVSLEKGGDLETAVAKLIDQATRSNVERFKHAIKIKDLLVEAVSSKWSFAEKHMVSIEYDAKIRDMEVNLKEHEKFAHQASLNLQFCENDVKGYSQQLSAAKRHAESIAIITPELEKLFLEMPTTIEELEAAIQDNISQANSIVFLNRNILQEYEDRQHQIEAISAKLDADNKELQRCLAEIDALKGNWLPTLRNLVSQINETFSRNFQEMAVAGEVSLDEHDMDFDQFGVLVKVKFRQAGQLQVLSAHHQSGGERSVSTILYLVSLQDLTNCPFRVVDEINQGMDPINERKMFQQLVRAATQPNTPQCFLLTPKLLPNLEYSEACSILNIMNGPWIETPSKVWSSGECWATIAGLVKQNRC